MIPPDIRIASPCSADWNKMQGDDRVRHCSDCNLNVYNFAAMTDLEVERLIAKTQGRLCARIYRRADGTILTQNCPVGLRARIKKVSRIAGAALSAAMGVVVATAQTLSPNHPAMVQPEKGSASLNVHVLDQSGTVIENVQISLQSISTHRTFTGVTTASGDLVLSQIPVGEYDLSAQSLGFKVFHSHMILQTKEVKKMEIVLRVGEMPQMGVIVGINSIETSTDLSDLPSQIVPQ